MGESLFVHERYDSARVIWRASLERARTNSDQDLEARALTSIAYAAYRLTDFDEARASAEQSLALSRNSKPTRNLGKTYNVLGLLTKDDRRFVDASRFLEQAVAIARATNDSVVLASAAGNLGLTAMNLGDTRRAREAYREKRRLARALRNAKLEGNSFTNEANIDVWEGNPRPAFPDSTRRVRCTSGLSMRPGSKSAERTRRVRRPETSMPRSRCSIPRSASPDGLG